jgi:hypothetical protein
MYNGKGFATGLSGLTNLDEDHLEAFLEMTKAYSRNGENDPEFHRLANDCLGRREEN